MTFFAIVLGLILLALYGIVALQPAAAAFLLVSWVVERDLATGEQSGFWQLFDKVQRGRRLAIASLIFLLLGFGGIDAILGFKVLALFNFNNQATVGTLVVACLVAAYLVAEFYFYGKVTIPVTEHKKTADAKRLLDNLSITSGTPPPELLVLAHTNPSCFSTKRNFGETKIYLTSALLNLCDERELEAVLAREQAFHATKHNSHLRLVNNLLLLLKLLGFVTLFLALDLVSDALPLVLILTVALAYARISLLSNWTFVNDNGDLGEVLMRFANPPLMLAVFLSFVLQYSLAWREDIFADLKAVDYTRYPPGLYNIFSKLRNYQQSTDFLPQEFAHLYLTGERTVRGTLPMFQPPIDERLAVLARIDSSLGQSPSAAASAMPSCPACGQNFMPVTVLNALGQQKQCLVCAKSGHCWFDSGSLYELSSAATLNDLPLPAQAAAEPLGSVCPRCGIPLEPVADSFLPKNIGIFHCSGCQGDLLTTKDLSDYLAYRKAKESQAQQETFA